MVLLSSGGRTIFHSSYHGPFGVCPFAVGRRVGLERPPSHEHTQSDASQTTTTSRARASATRRASGAQDASSSSFDHVAQPTTRPALSLIHISEPTRPY